jgi:para-nitrobenzyl esterase
MPSAKGLFHRAIVQSSVMLGATDASAATGFAERLMADLGLKRTELDKLQQLPHQQVSEAFVRVGAAMAGPPSNSIGLAERTLLSPVMDGNYLPLHPFEPVAAPTAAAIPLLIGTNKDETLISMARQANAGRIDEDELLSRVRPALGDKTEQVLSAYRRSRPDASPWDLLVALSSEGRRLASILVAERKIAGGPAPVYSYLFDWETDYGGGLYKACHALEIPFVFDNADDVPLTGTRADRPQLAAAMSRAWANFARSGDPNVGGLPRWEPYDAENRSTMVFDVPCHAERDPRREERLAWGDLMLYR